MITFKIYTQEDLEQIHEVENVRVEIYAKELTINWHSFSGDLYIRAAKCNFPNLEIMKGVLSIDAPFANFPKLEKVYGNINIHGEAILLPKLEKIFGNLKVHYAITFPRLKFITGKLIDRKSILNNSITSPKSIADTWIDITNQKALDAVQENDLCNLNIRDCNVTLRIENIYGNLKISNAKVTCTNLKAIYGNLDIAISENKKNYVEAFNGIFNAFQKNELTKPLKAPDLKTIYGKCTITSIIPITLKVHEIHDKIVMHHSKVRLTNLEKAKSLIIKNGSELISQSLTAVHGKVVVDFNATFSSPTLHKINGGLEAVGKVDLPSLVTIGGDLRDNNWSEYTYFFPKLNVIHGSTSLTNNQNYPELEKINGTCTISKIDGKVAPKLSHVGTLRLRGKNIDVQHCIPNLQSIQTAKYNDLIPDVTVEEIFHSVRKTNQAFLISKESFYFGTSLGFNKIAIAAIIAIFKMRHQSFQNFLTREVHREWTYEDNEDFQLLLESLERKWKKIKAENYSSIFNIKNFSLRRFAFNYVGVSEMMKALKAKRIASDGIAVKHFQYDELGNKSIIEKHNIYETYEADFNKVAELRSWRNNKQLAYAVKCWCTSTNKEHWLWIEEKYKETPLWAIASTFRIHENVIPHIACLKRQGDILICEMKRKVIPKGEVRPLTKTEYFELLVAES